MSPSLRLGPLYVSSTCHLAVSHASLLWSRQLTEGLHLERGTGFSPGSGAPFSPQVEKPRRGRSSPCLCNTFSDSGLLLVFRSPSQAWPDLWFWTRTHVPPNCAHTEHATQFSLLSSLCPFPRGPSVPGTRADSCEPSPGPPSQLGSRSFCLWCVSNVWFVHRSKCTAFMLWPLQGTVVEGATERGRARG